MSLKKNREQVRKVAARSWADQRDQGIEPTAVKLPEGVSRFNPKNNDTYEIDIIPYVVGKGNPSADEGMQHFERTFFVHWLPSLSGGSRSYCCLAQTFKKKCPVCDFIRTANETLAKELKAKVRMLWRVIDRNEPKKGIQVWETPYFKGFGEILKNKLKGSKKGRYDNFDSLVGGMTLEVTIGDGTMGDRSFKTVTNVEIVPRGEDYPEDMIDEPPVLDDCLLEMSYQELKALLEGDTKSTDDDDEDDDEEVVTSRPSKSVVKDKEASKPSKNGKHKVEEDDEDEQEENKEDSEEDRDDDVVTAQSLGIEVGSRIRMSEDDEDDKTYKVLAIRKEGTELRLVDDDGDNFTVDVSQVVLVKTKTKVKEDKDEDEAPVRRGPGRPKGSTNKPKEEDEDEEDDEPVRKSPGRPRKS